MHAAFGLCSCELLWLLFCWLGFKVQGTQALNVEKKLAPVNQGFHAAANVLHSGCETTGALFIHFGLGCHGGESIDSFFDHSGFAHIFWNSERGRLGDLILADLRAGQHHLPQIQGVVAEAAQKHACGNVFLGDIKPNWVAKLSGLGYQQLFQSLDMAFPHAVWIWLIRHPYKYATSMTHFYHVQDESQADNTLQVLRREHAGFHCGALQHFGNRTLGRPVGDGEGNGKGDVVQLNLEKLDWPQFVLQLNHVSGYQPGLSSEGGMPRVGHHNPSWKYPMTDTDTWNPWDYMNSICDTDIATTPKPGDAWLPRIQAWDDEADSGW